MGLQRKEALHQLADSSVASEDLAGILNEFGAAITIAVLRVKPAAGDRSPAIFWPIKGSSNPYG
jgi:hypothetical protein